MLAHAQRVCNRPVAILDRLSPGMNLVLSRMPRIAHRMSCLVVLCTLVAGCASTRPRTAYDPIEPVNRAVFKFNDTADRYVMRPVARLYEAVLPQFVRTGVRNFFNNLDDVVVVANDLLQLKFTNASRDSVRFVANTVFGGLGLVDVASMRGLTKRREDFGQTLGYWGVGNGPFLMLPFLGPSTLRDAGGIIADARIDPQWQIDDVPLRNSVTVTRIIDLRASLLPADKVLEQQPDRYSFLRDAYLQRRRNLIYDGDPPKELLDDDLEDPGEGSADSPEPASDKSEPPAQNAAAADPKPDPAGQPVEKPGTPPAAVAAPPAK